MLFNSLTFLVFFVLVLSAYQLPLPWQAKKVFLLLASYFFYAHWFPPFLILLLASTVLDYFLSGAIYKLREPSKRKALLIFSLAVNLSFLSFFKYGNFFLKNIEGLMHSIGFSYSAPAYSVLLPLGISFYTFEAIAYMLDVYRGRIQPAKSLVDYALYIAFFPHLIAGPIVRAYDFLPQCEQPRNPTRSQFHWGLTLMVIGLFNKMVIADFLMAPVTEKIFRASAVPNFTDSWLGTFAFSIQIFCDFSGYSTCAIGAALCFGFVLTRNFHFPYGASGFSDFWKRWHISLSTWLRDYLYIPLGGNRKGSVRTYSNLMITMLLGGLWHGAAWTFVVWGGLHGLYLCLEKFLREESFTSFWENKMTRFALGILTYLGVCVAWTFFRAPHIRYASGMIANMFSGFQPSALLNPVEVKIVLGVTAAVVSLHALLRKQTLKRIAVRIPWWIRGAGLVIMVLLMCMASGEDRSFIYFQF